jgi:hypothetical protein
LQDPDINSGGYSSVCWNCHSEDFCDVYPEVLGDLLGFFLFFFFLFPGACERLGADGAHDPFVSVVHYLCWLGADGAQDSFVEIVCSTPEVLANCENCFKSQRLAVYSHCCGCSIAHAICNSQHKLIDDLTATEFPEVRASKYAFDTLLCAVLAGVLLIVMEVVPQGDFLVCYHRTALSMTPRRGLASFAFVGFAFLGFAFGASRVEHDVVFGGADEECLRAPRGMRLR